MNLIISILFVSPIVVVLTTIGVLLLKGKLLFLSKWFCFSEKDEQEFIDYHAMSRAKGKVMLVIAGAVLVLVFSQNFDIEWLSNFVSKLVLILALFFLGIVVKPLGYVKKKYLKHDIDE